MYLCKFGENLSIGSKDNARKRSYADADGIYTKNNMSHILTTSVSLIDYGLNNNYRKYLQEKSILGLDCFVFGLVLVFLQIGLSGTVVKKSAGYHFNFPVQLEILHILSNSPAPC